MKKQIRVNRHQQVMFAIITIVIFIFALSSSTFAQKFKPGDRVEVDPSGIQSWMSGTVLAYTEKDEPKFQGQFYLARVLIDKWKATYPEGVMVDYKNIRPSQDEAPAAPNNQNEAGNNPPEERAATKNGLTAKFKPGDRIECDSMNIGTWFKGTVLPFKENDNPNADKDKTGKYFYIHRVLEDRDASTRPAGGFCFTDRMRPLAGGAQMEIPKTAVPIGKVTVDENNTLSADRPIIECPIEQKPVKNGVSPNVELLKKIVRCRKGEIAASKGMDGAVTVEVTALQLGATRQWIYSRDIGGKPGTLIHPVKVTYTVKTFYRSRTDVSQNWIRILNFYVNEFGEWTVGSEEPIKVGERIDVPRLQ